MGLALIVRSFSKHIYTFHGLVFYCYFLKKDLLAISGGGFIWLVLQANDIH